MTPDDPTHDDPTHDDPTHDDPAPDDMDALAQEWVADAVLAALAEGDATSPPAGVRDAVLRHAAATPRPTVRSMPPAAVYAARVAALREVIASLDTADWQRVAEPYDWTVQQLVAHLTAIELHTAAQLGLCAAPDGDPLDHLGLGAALIGAAVHETPEATARRWSESAELIVAHATDPGFDLEQPLPLHGWPFHAGTALVARAFELWTHADDIRRAAGRPLVAPSPEELRTMSSVSVGSLPAALHIVAPNAVLSPTRVVLTGAGGGTFDLRAPAAPDPEERTVLVLDVVDYCRVVARRLAPERLDCEIEGDGSLVAELLEASRILAV